MDELGDEGDFSLNPEGEHEADEAELRAALHFHVGEICSAEASGKPMTGAAVSTLAEVRLRTSTAVVLLCMTPRMPDLRVFRIIVVDGVGQWVRNSSPCCC